MFSMHGEREAAVCTSLPLCDLLSMLQSPCLWTAVMNSMLYTPLVTKGRSRRKEFEGTSLKVSEQYH